MSPGFAAVSRKLLAVKRPPQRAPLRVLATLAALAAAAMSSRCSRGGPAPAGAGAPVIPEIAAASRPGKRVLFVGLDGADWDLLDRYVAAGAMPNLAAIVRDGRSGILRTIHPPLSPLVWTTMMTGVGPIEHGILDFTRFAPGSGRREPITSEERRVPAVWNMACWAGRTVAVLGMWASWPAERVDGVVVSDRLFSFQYDELRPPAGAVFPKDREPWARDELRRSGEAIDFAALKTYLPWLGEREYADLASRPDPYASPVSALRRILLETRVYHRLAAAWLRERPTDLAIVYVQGTDTIGHVFAPYAPPRQTEITQEEFERYSRVPERYFREVDAMLGEYRDLAREAGAVLVLASDHGFRWSDERPRAAASLAAATAGRWHRDDGIWAIVGPGIAPAPRDLAPAAVARVAATLLALLGLPPGRGLAGPPLPGVAASSSAAVDYEAYSAASSPWHAVLPETQVEDDSAAESLEKLRSLGYIGAAEPMHAPASAHSKDETRTAGSYNNEGLILREQGKTTKAREAFEHAIVLDPHHASALWNLSELLASEEPIDDRADDLLLRAVADALPEGVKAIVSRANAHRRAGRSDRGIALLGRAIAAFPNDSALWLYRGRLRVEGRECEEALADFRRAIALDAASAPAWASSGLARDCLGDRAGAARDLERSLALDPDQPELRRILAGE